MVNRFRGLLPIVIDVETSGLNPLQDALLEIAMVPVLLDEKGQMYRAETHAYHVEPFLGAHFDPEALEITGIDPTYPLRFAIPEQHALHLLFRKIEDLLIQTGCRRAVWVAHNAWFDLAFIQAATVRCHFKKVPYHSFTTFDTATLAAAIYGETVLAKAMRAAKIPFDVNKAHSARYDAEHTAKLFCKMINKLVL
ncbi:MAG: ribonuclease T [Gammaproteobacteria bacterium]|nr:ribonuclease T [Gammaproteobacteria bacterium]